MMMKSLLAGNQGRNIRMMIDSLGTTGFNPKLKGIKAEFVLKYVFICSKTKFKIRPKNFHGEKSYDELKFKKILNSK